jgi:hypothetical protein
MVLKIVVNIIKYSFETVLCRRPLRALEIKYKLVRKV